MSELDQAPISPREAAAFLAGQQSRDDDQPPVSDGADTFLTGHRHVESSQGYEPMKMALDVKEAAAAELEPSDAAKEIANRKHALELEHAGRSIDAQRNYYHMGGENHGKPMPSNQTVSAEQAASDLTSSRQMEAAELERLEAQELARTIDQLRAGDQQQQVEQQALHPNDVAAQPEAPPVQQPQDNFDLAKEFEKNPKLLAAVQKYVGQANQQADQIANYYRQAVAHNAEVAAAALVNQWPELKGLQTQEQFKTAIQTVAISNPQRAQAMVQHIEQTRAVINEQQRVAAAHAESQRQYNRLRWEHDAKQADREYELWSTENLPDGQAAEIQKEALAMLRENMSEEQIGYHWNNNPLFRSFPGQRIMADAARYRIAQRGIQSKAHHPVPVVQRPGSPEARVPEGDYRQRQLSSRLDGATGRDALKIAAEMVTARRNARRWP